MLTPSGSGDDSDASEASSAVGSAYRTTLKGARFEWREWRMESTDGESEITVPGRPVSVAAAYSGRIACAYQTGETYSRKDGDRYVNLCVGIYECESTGEGAFHWSESCRFSASIIYSV